LWVTGTQKLPSEQKNRRKGPKGKTRQSEQKKGTGKKNRRVQGDAQKKGRRSPKAPPKGYGMLHRKGPKNWKKQDHRAVEEKRKGRTIPQPRANPRGKRRLVQLVMWKDEERWGEEPCPSEQLPIWTREAEMCEREKLMGKKRGGEAPTVGNQGQNSTKKGGRQRTMMKNKGTLKVRTSHRGRKDIGGEESRSAMKNQQIKPLRQDKNELPRYQGGEM